MIIGLTGQTGAGKSTVSQILRDQGAAIVDADQVARQVVGCGSGCLAEIALEFGIGVLQADGTLNRRKLGDIVFHDKQKLRRLNQITFPYITREIQETIDRHKREGTQWIILDAPTLFESGSNKMCDKVISVIASPELRRNRIMIRDNITEEQADSRIASQHEDEFYTQQSDYVLENSGDMAALRVQLLELLDKLEREDG
ncbi:MAG TPA: dephospho-CoA kinase [Firmicutes bacterium]|nr:dephospho-CoA kinase [Bacillota bacterium]